jgi:hypothetical protein
MNYGLDFMLYRKYFLSLLHAPKYPRTLFCVDAKIRSNQAHYAVICAIPRERLLIRQAPPRLSPPGGASNAERGREGIAEPRRRLSNRCNGGEH